MKFQNGKNMKKLTMIFCAAIMVLCVGCQQKAAEATEQTENETVKSTTMEDLLTRRSVRSYTDSIPPIEVIEEICKAGTYAPTGMNRQSPIIIAVTNKEMRDRMSKLNAAVMGVDSDPFYGAPVVLVVLADKNVHTYLEDGSLVMGNLMNAAHALGLGSCWIHRAREVFESEEGKQILADLGIEGDYVGIGNCILGYTAGEYPKARDRKENWVYWVK
jgi:nitroreductase